MKPLREPNGGSPLGPPVQKPFDIDRALDERRVVKDNLTGLAHHHYDLSRSEGRAVSLRNIHRERALRYEGYAWACVAWAVMATMVAVTWVVLVDSKALPLVVSTLNALCSVVAGSWCAHRARYHFGKVREWTDIAQHEVRPRLLKCRWDIDEHWERLRFLDHQLEAEGVDVGPVAALEPPWQRPHHTGKYYLMSQAGEDPSRFSKTLVETFATKVAP